MYGLGLWAREREDPCSCVRKFEGWNGDAVAVSTSFTPQGRGSPQRGVRRTGEDCEEK
jgi:hypothetical protein